MVRLRVWFVSGIVGCVWATLGSLSAQVTVVQRSGPQTSGYVVESHQVLGTTWSQTSAFTGVSVFATIEDGPDPGFAYLTNQIGPGTTAANEIASGAFSFPAASTETLLFSGLTLPAGTYYLTLTVTNSGSGGWFGTNTPTATTAAGVTLFPDYDTFTPAAYPPATSFFTPTSTNLIFRVTAIPESSALIQFLLGGGLIAFLGLRRSVVRAAEE